MKKLLLLIFVCTLLNPVWGQYLPQRNDNTPGNKYVNADYKDHRELGEYSRGVKHGQWQIIGVDSTIYVEGQYEYGKWISDWIVYYPDGGIRYITTFDSLGWPVEWTRYYNGQKIVSIHREHAFDEDAYNAVLAYESQIISKEMYQHESSTAHEYVETDEKISINYTSQYYEVDVPLLCKSFHKMLKVAPKEYEVTEYLYPGEMIAGEYLVGNDAIISKTLYTYKNKKLKKIEYYQFDKLVKTEIYDKNGEVAKVKEH